MNRQWMYGDRHTSEYIKGVHDFLEVAEANKQNGFVCCPCGKYALEAIINGYYYISLFMIIVYCSCYNCVIRKS